MEMQQFSCLPLKLSLTLVIHSKEVGIFEQNVTSVESFLFYCLKGAKIALKVALETVSK